MSEAASEKTLIKDGGSGLGWHTGAFFVVSCVAGGAIIAVPAAFTKTGLPMGVLFLVLTCVLFAYSALLLGENWVIMQTRWPVYQEKCREPYPEMALRSMGQNWRIVTYVLLNFTCFSTSIVFLLLSSRIIRNFLSYCGVNINFCYMLIIIAVVLLPVTFLKSPAEFWIPILIGMFCAFATVAFVMTSTAIDFDTCIHDAYYPKLNFLDALLSLGTFMFAYCAHTSFPTIQHDMYHPKDFTKSVVVGFIVVALLYMPLSIFAYIVYGDSMKDSVTDSVQITWMRFGADLSAGFHCILSSIMSINPLNQEIENKFGSPHKFCIKRVLVRTLVMAGVLFVALTVPDFISLMNLFGSTTTPIISLIMPCLFNLWLKAAQYENDLKDYRRPTIKEVYERTSKIKLCWMTLINVATIFGAVVALYMAVKDMATVKFVAPCYVQPFVSSKPVTFNGDEINCCGRYRNVHGHGNSTYCRA